jgi:hypothetical protein
MHGFLLVLAATVAFAAEAGLPVTRVVLYKNGVGYFEHLGRVRGNQDVPVAFTSGQLNDVLKSLTVLDLNGGRVTGVGYGSSEPVDRQRGDLRLPVGDKATLTEFLGALRGARLEVRSGTSIISGRLLSVERKTRISGGTTLEVDYLALAGDHGELRTAELAPPFSVRILEPGLEEKVGRYLDLASQAREPDLRQMVISTAGTGERTLFVSYVSEVPVWKTTYRLVLNPKTGRDPLLQGWAVVDNTVGQDWNSVQLSLVAGAPQSFIQNLSQPYYIRRPVVNPPGTVNFAPQTHQATLVPGGARVTGKVSDPTGAALPGAAVSAYDAGGQLLAQTVADPSGTYELRSLPEGVVRLQVDVPGFRRATIPGVTVSSSRETRRDVTLQIGGVAETVTVTAVAPAVRLGIGSGGGIGAGFAGGLPGVSFSVEAARARSEAAAMAQNLGDLFEYRIKEPVTILKNRSALVPIVNAPVAAEKVSIWNEQAGLPRPQRAVWLTNGSGLTLDGGTFMVLEEETFAGEGLIESMRPGEKRLVSYALDLALNASSALGSEQQPVTRVLIRRGTMTCQSEMREKKTYTFRNEDSAPRGVIVEHPVRSGYQLRGEARPAETTPAWMRFRLTVEPKQTAALVVEEARPLAATYTVRSISGEQVALFVSQKSIDRDIEEALRKILVQKEAIDELEERKSGREEEMSKLFDDQQRVRENMKALKGSPEERALVQRYTRQLDEQENVLVGLRKEIKELAAKKQAAEEALNRMIEELAFDVKL